MREKRNGENCIQRSIPGAPPAATFFAAIEVGLTLVAVPCLFPDYVSRHCEPGSRGRICIVQRTTPTEQVGANIITVPTATAIPEMVTPTDQVWLRATGIPAADPVTITITAPDGTNCVIDQTTVSYFNGVTQAFAVPADCASVEGVWSAAFNHGIEYVATAGFLVVPSPQVQPAP